MKFTKFPSTFRIENEENSLTDELALFVPFHHHYSFLKSHNDESERKKKFHKSDRNLIIRVAHRLPFSLPIPLGAFEINLYWNVYRYLINKKKRRRQKQGKMFIGTNTNNNNKVKNLRRAKVK